MSDVEPAAEPTVELPNHGDIEWAVKTVEPVSAGLWKPGAPPTSQDHWDAVCTLADAYLADRAARQALDEHERNIVSVIIDWPAINVRRCALIDCDIYKTITPEEAAELERLQQLADLRQSVLAPNDYSKLFDAQQSLIEELERDAARLDWLDAHPHFSMRNDHSVRDQIDAAMQETSE